MSWCFLSPATVNYCLSKKLLAQAHHAAPFILHFLVCFSFSFGATNSPGILSIHPVRQQKASSVMTSFYLDSL